MPKLLDPNDSYDSTETIRRREAALKRMLATPPKPHSDSKVSRKPKAKAPKLSHQSGYSGRGAGVVTSRRWFGPIAVLAGFVLVAVIMTYLVEHSANHPRYLSRIVVIPAIVGSALFIIGLAKLFLRIRYGYWKALPPFEPPQSWEAIIRTVVYVGVFAALAVIAIRLLSN